MSDQMALGLYDADGSILFKKNELGHEVDYCFGQSKSKDDVVQKFAEKFNGSVGKISGEFRANQSSNVGKKVRKFLAKNKHPLRDFLLSEKVIELLKQIKKIKENFV